MVEGGTSIFDHRMNYFRSLKIIFKGGESGFEKKSKIRCQS